MEDFEGFYFHYQYKGEPTISLTLDKDINIDQFFEGCRRFAIACGYHPETVKRVFGEAE